jgi:hypothetical protein
VHRAAFTLNNLTKPKRSALFSAADLILRRLNARYLPI